MNEGRNNLIRYWYFHQKIKVTYSRYEYQAEDFMLFYEFISIGPKGSIKKVVEYTATSVENVFNPAFGDYDEITGLINDKSITNNGDSQKVLATAASTVYAFSAKYPNAWIYITGSTKDLGAKFCSPKNLQKQIKFYQKRDFPN